MDLQQIFRKLGIENLNDMQRQTADMLLHRSNDVVVLSATGSGKTLAYLLPLVQMLRADVGKSGVVMFWLSADFLLPESYTVLPVTLSVMII